MACRQKCVWCTREVWTSPIGVRLNQGQENRVRAYGGSEVGSSHSSDEICENRRSEGATNQPSAEVKHGRFSGPGKRGNRAEVDKVSVGDIQQSYQCYQ